MSCRAGASERDTRVQGANRKLNIFWRLTARSGPPPASKREKLHFDQNQKKTQQREERDTDRKREIEKERREKRFRLSTRREKGGSEGDEWGIRIMNTTTTSTSTSTISIKVVLLLSLFVSLLSP